MRKTLVPIVLGAMAVMAFVLTGCQREETAPVAAPTKADPPEVYMKDPVFQKALAEKRAVKNEILARRETLLNELESRVDAMRKAMPGADDAAVKAALEKDPDWNSLVKRIEDLNEAYNDNRKATTKIVGERLAPHPVK